MFQLSQPASQSHMSDLHLVRLHHQNFRGALPEDLDVSLDVGLVAAVRAEEEQKKTRTQGRTRTKMRKTRPRAILIQSRVKLRRPRAPQTRRL